MVIPGSDGDDSGPCLWLPGPLTWPRNPIHCHRAGSYLSEMTNHVD